MSENVFIFGAGFSKDAGIPLLANFAQVMWDIAARGSFHGVPLTSDDKEIFAEAVRIRDVLDGYHGRANFNDRNIEDILSILAIGAYANDTVAQQQLSSFRKGIARTIELTCGTKHPGLPQDGRILIHQEGNPGYYHDFWEGFFRWGAATGSVPTIITFNYDLVLERSLFHFFNGTRLQPRYEIFPRKHLRLSYHDEVLPSALFEVVNCQFGHGEISGTGLRRCSANAASEELEVELLKLHGSVNFHKSHPPASDVGTSFVTSVEDPNILPPIFNKMSNSSHAKIWDVALKRLRSAKRVVIVGYSLPQSDIYMQYFLKAALGPNRSFDKLTVYDPTLFTVGDANDAMRQRYAGCFAVQLQSRIDFNPQLAPNNAKMAGVAGTAYDFICTLNRRPSQLLF